MSTSALKWTALVLMVLDHLGEFFPGQISLSGQNVSTAVFVLSCSWNA